MYVTPGDAVRFPAASYVYPLEVIWFAALYVRFCADVALPVSAAPVRSPLLLHEYVQVTLLLPPAWVALVSRPAVYPYRVLCPVRLSVASCSLLLSLALLASVGFACSILSSHGLTQS
ncbi:hypothetical protein DEI92_07580 [Curtobacterium sp. MCBD17_034]|nr:hypothetical protein DEI92_07580 [Curtobacterium sp. MCBD17_034]PZM34905.1 hypothetical protein DEI90_05565 [Curtobacterium sp. MCBD17_031]